MEEIIKVINGSEKNPFRDMITNLNYTILFRYKIKQQGVAGIIKNDVIEKFHLKSYLNFKKDKNKENNINKFDKEYDEYKNLSIHIKNVYEIYKLLVVDSKYNYEKRNKLEEQYLKERNRRRKFNESDDDEDSRD